MWDTRAALIGPIDERLHADWLNNDDTSSWQKPPLLHIQVAFTGSDPTSPPEVTFMSSKLQMYWETQVHDFLCRKREFHMNAETQQFCVNVMILIQTWGHGGGNSEMDGAKITSDYRDDWMSTCPSVFRTLCPITGHFREALFLLAALQMQMSMHVPSDGESLSQWRRKFLFLLWQQLFTLQSNSELEMGDMAEKYITI